MRVCKNCGCDTFYRKLKGWYDVSITDKGIIIGNAYDIKQKGNYICADCGEEAIDEYDTVVEINYKRMKKLQKIIEKYEMDA